MLKSYYEINRKSKKWWQRIFWHFVDVTLVNSFIIYSQLFPEKNMKLKLFRLSVVDSLIKIPNGAKRGRPPSKSAMNYQKKLKISNSVRMTNVDHLPVVQKGRLRFRLCYAKERQQLTQFYCTTCNCGLCINADRKCFQKFHQK